MSPPRTVEVVFLDDGTGGRVTRSLADDVHPCVQCGAGSEWLYVRVAPARLPKLLVGTDPLPFCMILCYERWARRVFG